MINIEICSKISKAAVKALLYEVNISPKPGLVDRFNTGSHNDMDIFTFIDSALILEDYFYDCCIITMNWAGNAKEMNNIIEMKNMSNMDYMENISHLDYRTLFNLLKKRGIVADHKMYKATDGINTHKGAIFSLGLISASAALSFVNNNDFTYMHICKYAGYLSQSLVKTDLDKTNTNEMNSTIMTQGRKIYQKYSIKGIRGEAESGFPTIREYSYPYLLKLVRDGMNLNDASVNVLMKIIMNTEDTNLISRGGLEGLKFARFYADNVLRAGGMSTKEGLKEVKKMDRAFIKKNLSPGGSADLLAVTLMLYFLG